MTLTDYLRSRSLSPKVIEELVANIPDQPDDGLFHDAARVISPDAVFYWPGQTRFVVVGQCPNGDGIAIDSQSATGAVFYVAHGILGLGRPLDEVIVRVANSPTDFVQRFLNEDDFPYDYWEAKERFA
jgi:hypothetical protein